MLRTAIIGTGITGLSIANNLNNALITFFQKSRRPGGRLTTRSTRQNNKYLFDHGVHFIDPQNQHNHPLIDFLTTLKCIKNVQISTGIDISTDKIVKKNIWVGSNNIEQIALAIYKNIKCQAQFNCRVTEITRNIKKQYYLKDQINKQFGPFDKVYVCLPYNQCKNIKQIPIQVQFNKIVDYQVVWTIMIAIKGPLNPSNPSIGIYEKFGGNIAKAVNQNIKKQKIQKDIQLWVFNMTNEWNNQHKQIKPQEVEKLFKQEIKKVMNTPQQYYFIKAHRWLYGFPIKSEQTLKSSDNSLIFCGDWVGNKQTLGQCWNLGHLIVEQHSKL